MTQHDVWLLAQNFYVASIGRFFCTAFPETSNFIISAGGKYTSHYHPSAETIAAICKMAIEYKRKVSPNCASKSYMLTRR